MKTWRTLLLVVAMIATSLVAPTTHAAPTVSASNAAQKIIGHPTNVWGSVSETGSTEVWTEALLSSGWSRSRVTTSKADGGYVLPLTYGVNEPGVYTYRVGAKTAAGTVYSPEFTVTRTPWTVGNAGNKLIGQHTNTWGTMPSAAGRSVWTEALRNGAWSRSQIRTADSKGYFVIPLTYGVNEPGTYTYRVVASTPMGQVTSETFTITRTAPQIAYSVTASTAGSKPVNEATNVWGTVKGHTRGSVWTEVLVAGSWSRSQTRTSDANGFYAIPLTYGASTPGTYTFRVGASTPSGTVYSSNVTLTRTGVTKPQPWAPQPPTTPPNPAPYYKNCTEAWNAGVAPLYRGEPGYGSHLDRDGDGKACEIDPRN